MKRCRSSCGAAQISARPVTSMKGAIRESRIHGLVGLNAASAITMTVHTTTPFRNPNSPPRKMIDPAETNTFHCAPANLARHAPQQQNDEEYCQKSRDIRGPR